MGPRSIAVALLFSGASMLMAGAPAVSMLTEWAVVRSIGWIFFQIAIAFIMAGTAARYLSRLGGRLPNERPATDLAQPALGGWLVGLAVALVALPVYLVVRLQPFFEGWALVIDYLSTWDWSGANASGSGLVLLPLAAALTPPMFELAAVVMFVVASAMLLVLLLSQSRRFPRVYVVCVVLTGAFVLASVLGAKAAALAVTAFEQFIGGTGGCAGLVSEVRAGKLLACGVALCRI